MKKIDPKDIEFQMQLQRVKIAEARTEMTKAVGEIVEKHKLTFTELYFLLADQFTYLTTVEMQGQFQETKQP